MTVRLGCSRCGVIFVLADPTQRPVKCGSCFASGTLSALPSQCTCAYCGTIYSSAGTYCPSCKVNKVVQKSTAEGNIVPYEIDPSQRRREVARPRPDNDLYSVSRKPLQRRMRSKISDD